MKKSPAFYSLALALLAAILFIPFLGAVHLFDWDEVNFAECAREMIRTGDYSTAQINFFPFWEKPPLFIWMQVLCMKTFGINEFAARLPNALCGITTLVLVYNLGRKIYDNRFGLLWALAFAGSLLPHFYFKSGIIDPWFNLFIFLGIYHLAVYSNDYSSNSNAGFFNRRIFLSGLFIALAILTKGPVAGLIFGLCFIVYRIWSRKPVLLWKHFFLSCITIACIGGIWFLILALEGRTSIITEFILYQIRLFSTEDADHGGPFYYHWVVLLIGCFPASVFAIRGFFRSSSDTPYQRHMKRWILILFWVVLILFSVVKTKIVHYSSLCYFPLTFLAAYSAYKLIEEEWAWKKWLNAILLFTGGMLGLLIMALPLIGLNKDKIIASKKIDDAFALANLGADVHWTGWEIVIGIIFLSGVVACVILSGRKQIRQAVVSLFVLTLIATNLSSLLFAPKVEGYSQKAAIDFYESLKGQKCYIDVVGFKSYAHLFYTDKQPEANTAFLAWYKEHPPQGLPKGFRITSAQMDIFYYEYLRSQPLDRPVYVVTKIDHVSEFEHDFPAYRKLSEKNGFVFYVRP
ncbi:MAG: ArnT family glycosyltransferase [Bacteroidia bacterium]